MATTKPILTPLPIPPNRDADGANQATFREKSNAWVDGVFNFGNAEMPPILNYIQLALDESANTHQYYDAILDAIENKIGDNPEVLLNAPIIASPLFIVSSTNNSISIGTFSANNFDKPHDITYVRILSGSSVIQDFTVTSGDLNNIPISGLEPSTQYIASVAVGADGHVSQFVDVIFTSSDKVIEAPTFTVEQDTGKAVNLADVTLATLPNSTNCTIDTVEMKITKVSDGTIVDTQSTTTLTLPIVFESQNLEENTEYKWEVRCRDTSLNVDSLWSSTTLFTTTNFLPRFNPISTKNCVALYLLNGSPTDEGGIYNGVWEETEAYTQLVDRSVAKFNAGSIRLPIDVEVTSKLNFTLSFSVRSTDDTQSGTAAYSEGLDSARKGLCLYYYPSSTSYSVGNYDIASNPINYGNLQAQTPLNSFIHHVIVRTDTLWEVYENGVKTAEYISDSTVYAPAYIPLIGDSDYGVGRNFKGELANFRFYHESLTAQEAMIIYQEDKIV